MAAKEHGHSTMPLSKKGCDLWILHQFINDDIYLLKKPPFSQKFSYYYFINIINFLSFIFFFFSFNFVVNHTLHFIINSKKKASCEETIYKILKLMQNIRKENFPHTYKRLTWCFKYIFCFHFPKTFTYYCVP